MERFQKLTVVFILLVTFARLLIINLFNLVPQEAYYWLYIQRPDFGYFDHPPMMSYIIGIFTFLFGDTEFGVRFGVVILSVITSLVMFSFVREISNDPKIGFYSVLFLNITVFYNIHSVVATPDSPLLCFWLISMNFFFKALKGEKIKDWILGGVFAGLALYSKYTALFIYFSLFWAIIFEKRFKFIFNYKPYLAFATSLLVFSPVIYWNFSNDWASFSFQTSERVQSLKSISLNYFFQLIASQLFELTPIFFVLLFWILFFFIKFWRKKSFEEKYLFAFSYPVVGFFFLWSFRGLVKMNWILPAYLSFLALATNFIISNSLHKKFIVRFVGFGLSLILIIFLFIVILFPVTPIKKGDTWNGWKELSTEITQIVENYPRKDSVFIFANEYKISAELAFYTKYKDRILAENVYGERALQFDLWFNPNDFKKWDGVFVYSDFNEFSQIEKLEKYFDKVIFHKRLDINKRGKVFRRFYIYICKGYRGK